MPVETFFLLSIVLGITMGFIVTGIAESKGRTDSKFGFFLFGFFFSLIALIYVLIMEKKEVGYSSNNHYDDNRPTKMKYCSECGAQIEFNSRYCSECGVKLTNN